MRCANGRTSARCRRASAAACGCAWATSTRRPTSTASGSSSACGASFTQGVGIDSMQVQSQTVVIDANTQRRLFRTRRTWWAR
ncbi:hypothetical protein M8494_16580 [Serratia ureilytica]